MLELRVGQASAPSGGAGRRLLAAVRRERVGRGHGPAVGRGIGGGPSAAVGVLPRQSVDVGGAVARRGDVPQEGLDQCLVAGVERQARSGRLPEDQVGPVGVEHGSPAVRHRVVGNSRSTRATWARTSRVGRLASAAVGSTLAPIDAAATAATHSRRARSVRALTWPPASRCRFRRRRLAVGRARTPLPSARMRSARPAGPPPRVPRTAARRGSEAPFASGAPRL